MKKVEPGGPVSARIPPLATRRLRTSASMTICPVPLGSGRLLLRGIIPRRCDLGTIMRGALQALISSRKTPMTIGFARFIPSTKYHVEKS